MTANKKKYVHLFTESGPLELLGGKGFGLVEMVGLKLPVPAGFIITTEACKEFLAAGKNALPSDLLDQIHAAMPKLADLDAPSIKVSIRSGAPVSMPGMMDTILDFNLLLASEASWKELLAHVKTIFGSWLSPRAKAYRRMNQISEDLATACVIQRMVFGTADADSGTGVVFTRNPNNGTNVLFGEWLKRASGDDLVSGAKTPFEIATFKKSHPALYKELLAIGGVLEDHFKDMQEIEFTVDSGKLWILQTRTGKRSVEAAHLINQALRAENKISEVEFRIRQDALPPLVFVATRAIAKAADAEGLPASAGIVSGVVAFSSAKAVDLSEGGKRRVILVTEETTPSDIIGMEASVGVVTAIGGVTSHAAVVGRSMGLPSVVGVKTLKRTLYVNPLTFTLNGITLLEGKTILTIDGGFGKVWVGDLIQEEKAA